MKHPSLANDLVPVNELRANLASLLKQVDETGRPIVITQRGKAAAVLIHPSELDELNEQRELVQKVLRGIAESEASELIEEDDLWSEVEELLAATEEKRASTVDTRSAG